MMKKLLALILVMLMMLSIVGCSSTTDDDSGSNDSSNSASNDDSSSDNSGDSTSTDSDGTTSTQDTITVNMSTDPGVIGLPANDAAITINKNIYEPLWMRDGDGVMQYRMADSIETEDGIHYTVHIRDGVYCSDGHEMTAEDVIFSFQWAREQGSSYASTTCIDLDSFELVDEMTFTFTLTMKTIAIENELQDWCYTWEGAVEENPTAPAGAGPYMLEEWVDGTSITLVRNPYYSFEEVPIETLTFTIVSESAQITNAMTTGILDYVKDVPSSEISWVESSDEFEIYSYPAFISQEIVYNLSGASVLSDDLDARKAIAYAIDNESLIQVVYQGYGSVANSPVSQNFVDFQDEWIYDDYYSYNTELAQQYMESSSVNWDSVTLVIATDGQDSTNTMAQMIQQSLSEVGINSKIENFEYATYSSNVLKKPDSAGWDIAIEGMQIGSGNTANFLYSWYSTAGTNISGWSNEEVTDLAYEALTNYDEVGIENCTEVVQILYDELPTYNMIHSVRVDAKRTNLNVDLQAQQTIIATGIKRFSRAYFE